VGVRGSDGLVKGCVGPLRDALRFRNAPPRRGEEVEFPHWDLLPTPCHLNQVDFSLAKSPLGLSQLGI
jgi:hypothetical protein